MEILFTPWRYSYITEPATEGCFFCDAGRDSDNPERLVVFRSAHHLVMLNRHPYSNGHLMVAPLAHLASPDESAPDAQREFWPLVLTARQILRDTYSPDGFNLGMNLGRTAGAGVPDHFHFHVVPRWEGDTSFMSVVGGVRLVPEDLQSTWSRLRRLFSGGDG